MPAHVTRDPRLHILADDPPYVERLLAGAEPSRWVLHSSTGTGKTEAALRFAEASGHLFVVVAAASLPGVGDAVSGAVGRHRLRGLFLQDEDPSWVPQLLARAGLRTLRNTLVHDPESVEVPRRILSAWLLGAQNDLVADARAVGDAPLVLTCAFETVEVPFEAHPALRRLSPDARAAVEVGADGAFLSWSGGDVELGLDALRYVTDPAVRARVDRESNAAGALYGRAIRALREDTGLRQTDVGGLSARQVRRIEKEGTTSTNALSALAAAHDLSLDTYLDELASRAAR